MALKGLSIKKNEIVLILTSPTKYQNTNSSILKYYVNDQKNYCLYISVNKTYRDLINSLSKQKINLKQILIIDTITPVTTANLTGENIVFIGNPRALTSISLAATKALNKMPEGKRILFLDSISSLVLFNNIGNVSKFSKFIINKMKEWKVSGAVISLEKDSEIAKYLSQIVDRVVEL